MRTLVHLSDLHFGRIDHTVIPPLIDTVRHIAPDLVAVSGDLTQRARTIEFKAARAFLDALPRPQIVVPGNHDVPLYNLFGRFGQRLDKYRRYICADLEPFYADEEMAVLGLNTARSSVFKGGRINEQQIACIRQRLCQDLHGVSKIIVTHHPFDLPLTYDARHLVGRAAMAMETLAACNADLLLAGHFHLSSTGRTIERYNIQGHAALAVQAGTATSTRGRGEANSFNVIRIAPPDIHIDCFTWQDDQATFTRSTVGDFRHTPAGWIPRRQAENSR